MILQSLSVLLWILSLNIPYIIAAPLRKTDDGIEIHTFKSFDNRDSVALHMPCDESNVFETKCVCHIYCKDPQCQNAVNICRKYEEKGCKYLFLRGPENRKFATLKRIPTKEESSRFDISAYKANDGKVVSTNKHKNTLIGELYEDLVKDPDHDRKDFINKIYKPNVGKTGENNYCVNQYKDAPQNKIDTAQKKLFSNGISLFVLSYHAPRTLLNSMLSWRTSGLLDLMAERIALLNDPYSEEVAIAKSFDFRVVTPNDIKNARISKPNVMTIGAAFYYALQLASFEYILFLENDFKMDISLPVQEIRAELLAGVGLLQRGVEIVRLQSRKWQGCGTFIGCDHSSINLHAADHHSRKKNWFAFYCKDKDKAVAKQYVSDCIEQPYYRCFTSWDSNWSLNAALFKNSTMQNTKYAINSKVSRSIAEIGHNQYQQQDGFESVMAFSLPWQKWRVPICISYNGLFIHEEIETGA